MCYYDLFQIENRREESKSEENSPLLNKETCLFYQVSTGQNLFLDPLNFRILMEQFKTNSNFPKLLSSHVLEIANHQQDSFTKKKYRFLYFSNCFNNLDF